MNKFAKYWSPLVLCGLIITAAGFSARAQAWDDRTDSTLGQYQLEELGRFEAGGVEVRFAMTAEARQIITTRTFDKPDPSFDEARFLNFVRETWKAGINYFHVLVPTLPFAEVNIILQDLKEDRRSTINLTTVNSRVVSMDLRRWHKIYLGFSSFLGAATSIHEFTHVNNYWLDEGEEKLHREQVAVVFEILHLAKLKGMDWVLANYLTNVAGVVANPQDLMSSEYKGMPPLRTLVHGLLKRVWDGSYKVSGDKMEAVEAWAAAYLEDGNKGDAGLNRAFVSTKLKTNNGNILTAAQWRADVYQSLGRP
ncbi:MAG: hypothetical protein A2X86_08425 [Bdellovibrionales bacterium GWA2_49_15]|nr:MAG: hypothetical protein A2X86_08425 [Bdellovibrionales bacterium GWA2_49_15]HAZ11213.1 hypothetical protein [Bdellovibrionales bacterium]